jgi:hypothetical protein
MSGLTSPHVPPAARAGVRCYLRPISPALRGVAQPRSLGPSLRTNIGKNHLASRGLGAVQAAASTRVDVARPRAEHEDAVSVGRSLKP